MELERQLRFATEEQGPEFNAHNNTTQHNSNNKQLSCGVMCLYPWVREAELEGSMGFTSQ